MIELKEHNFCESDEFFREYPGPLSNEVHLYYLKSDADKVIAHQKYKRCLAMAMMCEKRSEIYFSWSKKMDFISKWKLRWLELAEKFKEA